MTRGPKIITLLTDFGLRDPFVGVMKGVIASIAPRAAVVDLCHEVEPFAINQARFLLRQCWPYFPKGSIHVCVVDPGVGSARRAIAVQSQGHTFVGPDNGLFSDLIAAKGARTRVIANPKFLLSNPSQTFHGRDVFAPTAAHLAAGLAPAKLGPALKDPALLATGAPVRIGRRFWQGEIAHIDRFGNLVTNLDAAEFLPLVVKGLRLKVGFAEVARLVNYYGEADEQEAVLICGSAGTLEVSVNQGSAARKLGVAVGAPVELEVW